MLYVHTVHVHVFNHPHPDRGQELCMQPTFEASSIFFVLFHARQNYARTKGENSKREEGQAGRQAEGPPPKIIISLPLRNTPLPGSLLTCAPPIRDRCWNGSAPVLLLPQNKGRRSRKKKRKRKKNWFAIGTFPNMLVVMPWGFLMRGF